ncbi:MAG: hypothetical protein ACO1SV_07680 [Fimbriimonas sp.]
MSDTTKKVLLALVAIIFGIWALKVVVGIALGLLQLLVPVLIIAGIGYGLYTVFGRKALGGGSRRTLP